MRYEKEIIEIPVSEAEIKEIILSLNENNAKKFDELAEKTARSIKQIAASKLRQFYDYVKSMKKFDRVKLYLLKPKIAYAVGRDSKNISLKIFQKLVSLLIENCDTETKFENLKKFFEAVVAYHKIYNPRE